MTPRKRISLLLTAVLFSLFTALSSCSKNSTTVINENGAGQLSLSVMKSGSAVLIPKNGGSAFKTTAVDSIRISEASFLLRNIRFKSVDDDSLDFISDPLVVPLNLDGSMAQIGVADAPYGNYARIEFRVHRLDPNDPRDAPFTSLPEFQEFMQGDRSSIIIRGTVFYSEGTSPDFVFRSRANEKQRHEFQPPLSVDELNSAANVTLLIDPQPWFSDGAGGVLDPLNPADENRITDNLKNSIHPIKDNNRDGVPDNL